MYLDCLTHSVGSATYFLLSPGVPRISLKVKAVRSHLIQGLLAVQMAWGRPASHAWPLVWRRKVSVRPRYTRPEVWWQGGHGDGHTAVLSTTTQVRTQPPGDVPRHKISPGWKAWTWSGTSASLLPDLQVQGAGDLGSHHCAHTKMQMG